MKEQLKGAAFAVERKVLGVQLEDRKFFNPTYVAVEFAIRGVFRRKGISVEARGEVPREGAAFVLANHPTTDSVFLLPYAVLQLTKRPTVMVVRDTLLDPNIEEEPEVRARTGDKKDIFNSKNPFIRRPLTAVINRVVSPIPIHRGKPDRETFRSISKSLSKGRVVGIFLQETRTDEDDLTNAMEGIATLMWMNQDVPVYLLGISGVTKRIDGEGNDEKKIPHLVLDEPFTYKDIPEEYRKTREGVQRYVVERMAALIRPNVPNVRTKYDVAPSA